MIIDYFNLNLISNGKIIGGLLVILGLAYNLIIDKKQLNEVELDCMEKDLTC